jgi:hypothetical protein
MSFRFTTKTLLGAAAMAALSASLVSAQSRPTSTRRIPISKESPGEVMVRTDTVTVYKTDTLTLTTTRIDTVTNTVTNTVTRVDSVMINPPVRLPSGLYFGLAGGAMAPNGSLFLPNSAGPSFQAQLGWQGAKNLLGVRADVNYAKPGEDSQFSGAQPDPEIVNFSADAKLQLPFFTHLMGASHRFALYGIGGYTYTTYKNLPIRVDNPSNPNVALVAPGTGDWTGFSGWNAGGGASLMFGRTELFLETRVLAFNPDNAPRARQMPFMFGINFY